jgi:hypothetical protein
MVLDRDLTFTEVEMTFADPLQRVPPIPSRNAPAGNRNQPNNQDPLGVPPLFFASSSLR